MRAKEAHDLLEIIDSSSIGSFICDLEKGEMHYSSEWSKRLGIEHLSPLEATLVSSTHVHPEDRDHIHRVFSQACKQKVTKVKMEFRAKTVDSSYIWVLGQGKIIYNQDGKPVKYYGTHSDISEQKQAEEKLQRYAEELKQKEEETLELIDGFTEGSWIVDLLAGTIKCSEKWAKRIGCDLVSEEERLAYTHTLPHPDDTAGGNSIQHQIEIGAARFDLEYRVKTMDSGYIWTQNKGKITYNDQGEAVKVYAATIDITVRKLTEEKVTFQAKIIESVHDPVMATDMDFSITYWNKAAERVYGWTQEEAIGKNADILLAKSATRKDGVSRLLQNGIEEVETTHLRKDGSRINVVTTVSLIYDSNGQPSGTVGVLHDITERKQVEEALQESEKKANMLVFELEKADHNKTNFLKMLSHELRNPLASIVMSLELMEKDSLGGKQYVKAFEIAKHQGKQLANLVSDLLDVTRITQNKVALKKDTIEINEFIKKAAQDYQPQFIARNVKLEVQLTTPLYIEADPARIIQVIGNLLHNAAKFTRNNDLVTVAVSHDMDNNEAVITVQDTGRGIEPNVLENLFEPFMQADETLDRSNGGLGLGLAIVKGIAELHGGKVKAFSEGIGKGAKFTIWLPL